MTQVFKICKTVGILEYWEDREYSFRIRSAGRPERQVNGVMGIGFGSKMSCKHEVSILISTNVYVIRVPSARRAIKAVFR